MIPCNALLQAGVAVTTQTILSDRSRAREVEGCRDAMKVKVNGGKQDGSERKGIGEAWKLEGNRRGKGSDDGRALRTGHLLGPPSTFYRPG